MGDNVRTVHFMCDQGAEDLFRCEDNGRVYLRQRCDKDRVRWLTTCNMRNGYEADCDPEALSEFDAHYQAVEFMERYHMELSVAYSKIAEIVARYEKDADCNVDENSAWHNAIWSVLTGN